MSKCELVRSALLLLGAGVCVRGVVWALTLIYAVQPGAAALLLLGCVGVLLLAVGDWRDSDEAERYYTAQEARRRAARAGRRMR
jgi:hypothetical protein